MSKATSGILKLNPRGGGNLRDMAQSLRATRDDVAVAPRMIREYGLVEGAAITGTVKTGKRGRELASVESVCGLDPEAFRQRTPYRHLTAIDPYERFQLAASGEPSMRAIDLLAPIGKGTRGLIVSPPKSGKTTILAQIAEAIHASEPATRILVLLIDERPEEVTHFRRSVKAEVLASSSDQSVREHVALSELTLAHVLAELECGHDIVVLVDSLTRMGRAFNLRGSGTRRTMSGGLEAGVMEIPRRFFGMARKIEDGGSATIIATALVETGSRMDQLIFEEFKGTGNNEIVLDRRLAEQRIFPAINLPASGTRKEDSLYSAEEAQRRIKLRRMLINYQPKEAMQMLLELLDKYPTNEELLQNIPADG